MAENAPSIPQLYPTTPTGKRPIISADGGMSSFYFSVIRVFTVWEGDLPEGLSVRETWENRATCLNLTTAQCEKTRHYRDMKEDHQPSTCADHARLLPEIPLRKNNSP